jgi:hypothetical protein
MRLRKTTAGRNKIKRLQHAIEFLEPRQLLTTVHGGDVFQYQDPAGNIDRVVLKGNITAELIGATVGANNQVQLINLPGELNGVPINGGLNGAAGTQLIGNITVTDPTVPAGSPEDNTAPAISALASTSTGVSYGIVITPVTTGSGMGATTNNLVQVVTINNTTAAATVVAEISGQIIAAAGANFAPPTTGSVQVTAVTAAAFSPTNGLLYFVAAGGANNTPMLFTVNVNAGSRANIGNSVAVIPGTFGSTVANAASIGAITFDPSGNLWAIGNIAAGNNEVFEVNTTLTDTITGNLPVMLGNAAPTGTITGIAFQAGAGDILTALESFGAGTAGQVLSINDTTGQAQDFGSLASGTALGDLPGDMEFNPVLTDPFTGTTGALVATDTGTHQLFYVFPQNRGGTAGATLYAVYVSQSDINASISISQASSINGPMSPFTGTINLSLASTTGGAPTIIDGPADIGTAVLGAVVNVTPVGGLTTTYEPFFSASVDQNFGVLPTSFSTLNAGLIVASGQNLGNFLFGGTVLGNVNIQSSIQTFYAGWLLTGDANGVTAGTITNPSNFAVGGDIRNLLVTGPIGTTAGDLTGSAPSYLTGFDMVVQGSIGQIQTLAPGDSPIVGSINAYNLPGVAGLTSPQLQTEFDTNDPFGGFDQGELAGIDNNSFNSPQYLGSIDSSDIDQNNVAYVSGTLNATTGNSSDFYAVALMAGQTITVQLTPSVAGVLNLGVFSPSDVLIASDINLQDAAAAAGKSLQFTASVPGVYRFEVTTGAGVTAAGVVPYFLTIQGIGNLGIGAVVATGGFMDNTNTGSGTTPGIGVANGDFGGVIAGAVPEFYEGDTQPSGINIVTGGGAILSTNTETFAVSNGNLRVLTATSMGSGDTLDPQVAVPNGSVGLVETTGATDPTGATIVNDGDMFFNHPTLTTPNVIGGSYQVVTAGAFLPPFNALASDYGDLGADLLATGSIGDIRAGNIADPLNSEFKVGVGGVAENQTIGLIESEGDFGTLATGGPQIAVGLGGEVGYIMVPNDLLVTPTGHTYQIYRDNTFGGSEDTPFTWTPGTSAQIVDSSGNNVTFTPSQPVVIFTTSTTGTSSSSTTTTTPVTLAPAGAISLTLYGIEGDGGSAIIDATSTESMTISAQNTGDGQQIHIGRVQVEGSGAAVVNYVPVPPNTAVTSPITQPGIDGLPGLQLESGPLLVPLFLSITGSAPLDVLNTVITEQGSEDALGDATSITNTTGGEMASIIAGSIGTINVTGPLGSTQNSQTGAAILPRDTIPSGPVLSSATPLAVYTTQAGTLQVGDLYPLEQIKTAVQVEDGNILSITSGKSIGNVVVLGSIGRLSAGSTGIIGQVYGLNEADYTGEIGGTSAPTPGRILQVDIGGGIAVATPGEAAGANSRPGLFGDSAIGATTANAAANIYGTIASKLSIGSINLSGGGSIVDARIGDVTGFEEISDTPTNIFIPTNGSPVNAPVLNLGPITINGDGGIIGSIFYGSEQGTVSVPSGFGVVNSTFIGVGSSFFGGIVAGGYGIRDVDIEDMTTTGTLNATGSGINVATGDFSASVLFSDTGTIDTDTGITPNATNDLNAFFGTSASMPQIAGETVTGTISNLNATGSFNLGTVRAYQITATQPGIAPGTIYFANSIGSIITGSQIDGVSIITGKLGIFQPGGNVVDTSLAIAGTIKSIVLKADFTEGSSIIAQGNNGFIKKLVVDGNMDGTIQANRKITTVNITGTFSGSIKAAAINTVTMGNGLGTGTLSVYGPINKMVIGGNLATSGNSLYIQDKINTLQINGNLNANIDVGGNLGNLIVGGSVTTGTTVNVGNIMNVLRVAGDVQAGSTIEAKKIKRKLIKGAIDGTIIG